MPKTSKPTCSACSIRSVNCRKASAAFPARTAASFPKAVAKLSTPTCIGGTGRLEFAAPGSILDDSFVVFAFILGRTCHTREVFGKYHVLWVSIIKKHTH